MVHSWRPQRPEGSWGGDPILASDRLTRCCPLVSLGLMAGPPVGPVCHSVRDGLGRGVSGQ